MLTNIIRLTFKSIIILSCFIANMEQDIFLDMFFAFFFAVSENLFTFAAIKGSHWRNLPKVLSRVAVFRDAATFVRKADFRARQSHSSLQAHVLVLCSPPAHIPVPCPLPSFSFWVCASCRASVIFFAVLP